MKVLVVTTDAQLDRDVREFASRCGAEITACPSFDAARRAMLTTWYPVVVLDAAVERASLASFGAELRDATAPMEVLLADAVEEGATPPDWAADVLPRPYRRAELALRLTFAMRRAELGGTVGQVALNTAVEAAGDIIEITDPRAVLMYVNPAFERTLGFRRDEAVGSTPAKLIRSDMHPPEFFRELERTLAEGRVWKGMLISRSRSGDLVYLDSTISPVKDASGKVTHHVGVKRDVTARVREEQEMRQRNRELAEARDAALAANQAKSDFLANMSHELRTPLNAIIGYSEMLAEDVPSDESPELLADLGKITRAGRHLLALINDVLDIAKLEAGKMKLFVEEIRVADILIDIVGVAKPLFSERGNRLTLDTADDLGSFRIDATKVRQVLLNLIGNANKFTEAGEVTLVVRRLGEDGAEWIRFDISDTGIGMSAEKLAVVFEPFQQGDDKPTRKYGGTGLGLAISRRLCQMMGGRIEVVSEEGRGSTFTVHLPASVSDVGPPSSVE